MFIEIEEVIYGRGTFCLLVYTGELVRIKSKEISSYLYSLTWQNIKPWDVKDLRQYINVFKNR